MYISQNTHKKQFKRERGGQGRRNERERKGRGGREGGGEEGREKKKNPMFLHLEEKNLS